MSSSDADELTLAITELREAQAKRARIVSSRSVLAARLVREGLRSFKSGFRLMLGGAKTLLLPGSVEVRQGLVRGQEWVEGYKVDSGYHYELNLKLHAPKREPRSGLLSLQYTDENGTTVAWESEGFHFSPKWGYYKYVEASPEGTDHLLALDPPARAVNIHIRLVCWAQDDGFEVRSCRLAMAGASLEKQEEALGCLLESPAVSNTPISIILSETNRASDVQLARQYAETGRIVLFFYRDYAEKLLGSGVYSFSVDLFHGQYRRIAAVGNVNGECCLHLSRADFYSVLEANYYLYMGWRVLSHQQTEGVDIRSIYLHELLAAWKSGGRAEELA